MYPDWVHWYLRSCHVRFCNIPIICVGNEWNSHIDEQCTRCRKFNERWCHTRVIQTMAYIHTDPLGIPAMLPYVRVVLRRRGIRTFLASSHIYHYWCSVKCQINMGNVRRLSHYPSISLAIQSSIHLAFYHLHLATSIWAGVSGLQCSASTCLTGAGTSSGLRQC